MFRSMMTYKKTPITFTEDKAKIAKDVKGETWAPYLDSQRADHESIILQAERDWFMQGVPSHRIRNRVEQMKIFCCCMCAAGCSAGLASQKQQVRGT